MDRQIVEFIQDLFSTNGDINLHQPCIGRLEKDYLNQAIDSTFISSVGAFVDGFATSLENFCGVEKSVPLVNGTSALHAALFLKGVQADDIVITQSFTFVATCNAISYLGAEPTFVDISTRTLGLCPISLANYLQENAVLDDHGNCINKTSRKRISACVAVHTFGHAPQLQEIRSICRDWHIALIEDASQALGSTYMGEGVGANSDCATLSFNGNKIISTGGGGALLTKDKEFGERSRHITSTSRIKGKEIDHDGIGFNYRMPNINAALGCAQMSRLPSLLRAKRELAIKYQDFFRGSEYQCVQEPESCQSNYWLNTVVCQDRNQRDHLLSVLQKNKIQARPAWKLMDDLPMYKTCSSSEMHNARYFYQRIVCLPSSPQLLEK
ncbi:LegC family aminotransferase [Agarilytica rhodophyticola]|uniref:LegC family aminotransferase n=1 Tax=Agarilytica rhodophyticola TaxID=1737490 RepID=UPI000B344209|nr:LegC family aminotransferase [Agarilytica rhodophyticola]